VAVDGGKDRPTLIRYQIRKGIQDVTNVLEGGDLALEVTSLSGPLRVALYCMA